MPAKAMASVSSVVAMGRRMNGPEIFMTSLRGDGLDSVSRPGYRLVLALLLARKASGQPVEEEIDDRSRIKRQQLAEDKAANDGNAERPAQFRTGAGTEGERHTREEGGHGRHHNGAEAEQAGLIDGIDGSHAFVPFGVESEVDHHDGVLLHDADQQHDPDESNDAEVLAAN